MRYALDIGKDYASVRSAANRGGHADPSISCRERFRAGNNPRHVDRVRRGLKLGLRLRDDPATRLVAEKVVQFAQWGIRDVETLRALTLKEFRQSSSN